MSSRRAADEPIDITVTFVATATIVTIGTTGTIGTIDTIGLKNAGGDSKGVTQGDETARFAVAITNRTSPSGSGGGVKQREQFAQSTVQKPEHACDWPLTRRIGANADSIRPQHEVEHPPRSRVGIVGVDRRLFCRIAGGEQRGD